MTILNMIITLFFILMICIMLFLYIYIYIYIYILINFTLIKKVDSHHLIILISNKKIHLFLKYSSLEPVIINKKCH